MRAEAAAEMDGDAGDAGAPPPPRPPPRSSPQAPRPAVSDSIAFARDLHELGVVVVPVLDEQARADWEGRFFAAMDEFPEYKIRGREVQRVLGGFGALGNPSSFHAPVVRAFRRFMKNDFATPIMRELARIRFSQHLRTVRLETLFDRVCVRKQAFLQPSSESWHRDVYDSSAHGLRPLPKTLVPDDEIEPTFDLMFGGWTNLDHRDQHFVGLAGTHTDDDDGAAGFAAFNLAQVVDFGFDERLKGQANRTIGHSIVTDCQGNIVVPPGHAILFFQRIVHAVKGGVQPPTAALRVFHGYRLTRETTSLMDVQGVVDDGGVPRIPSGQMPAMYSKNHYGAFNDEDTDRWRNWARETFVDACLFGRHTKKRRLQYFTPGSQEDRDTRANRGRYMPSLAEMDLLDDRFRYSLADRSVLTPQPLFL